MSSAFELVKSAEGTAADLLVQAKEKAAEEHKAAANRIAQKKKLNNEQYAAMQADILQKEQQQIQEASVKADGVWASEKNELDQKYAANKESVCSLLIRRVLSQDGNR